MQKILAPFIFILMLGVSLWNPALVLAGEHGGSEHGGTAVEGKQMEGSHGMMEDHAATLREAASILKATHPDLAAKLEEMAEMKK